MIEFGYDRVYTRIDNPCAPKSSEIVLQLYIYENHHYITKHFTVIIIDCFPYTEFVIGLYDID